VIAAGEESDVIGKIFNGKKVGTLFLPEKSSSITASITSVMNELLINDDNGLKTSSSLTTLLQLPSSTTENNNNNNVMTEDSIEILAMNVRTNSRILQNLTSQERSNILFKIVQYLNERQELILQANINDMEKAEKRYKNELFFFFEFYLIFLFDILILFNDLLFI